MKGEDRLQTHKVIQSLTMMCEDVQAEIEVERDEWAKELVGLNYQFDAAPTSNKTGLKPKE